jgi:hypothetical protein
LRRATRGALAVATLAAALVTPHAAGAADERAAARAGGGDRDCALRVAQVLLAWPLDVQLMRVRCERVGKADYCGLTLSGVKFHRWIDTVAFLKEIDLLVSQTFAVDPAIAEVDVTTIAPADAAHRAVESGDFARPSAATVYATSVTRGSANDLETNAFWDPDFRHALDGGTAG